VSFQNFPHLAELGLVAAKGHEGLQQLLKRAPSRQALLSKKVPSREKILWVQAELPLLQILQADPFHNSQAE